MFGRSVATTKSSATGKDARRNLFGKDAMKPFSHADRNLLGRSAHRPLVSIMIPCLNEEQSLLYVIPELIQTLADDEQYAYELVFIDDHSVDATPQLLTELCRKHRHVKAIRLGRNCGSHIAYRAGLDYCSGDAIAFTVADLQEGPELIWQSLELWQSGAQVVGTVATGRDRGHWFNELGARVFYALRRQLGRGGNADSSQAALRVIDRTVAEHCRAFSPRVHNINTWIFEQPFTVEYLHYTPATRQYGKSRWTFRKKLRLVYDTLIDASPLLMTGWLAVGGLLLAGGCLTALAAISHAFTAEASSAAGWLGLLSAILICTGLILAASGTLGIYLWRVYEELREGPGYFAQPLDPDTTLHQVSDRSHLGGAALRKSA